MCLRSMTQPPMIARHTSLALGALGLGRMGSFTLPVSGQTPMTLTRFWFSMRTDIAFEQDWIYLDRVGQDRATAQAILFGPSGRLFVPITNANFPPDNPFTGEVRLNNVNTKTFDIGAPSAAKGGPLLNPWYLTFGETDPSTLAYDDSNCRVQFNVSYALTVAWSGTRLDWCAPHAKALGSSSKLAFVFSLWALSTAPASASLKVRPGQDALMGSAVYQLGFLAQSARVLGSHNFQPVGKTPSAISPGQMGSFEGNSLRVEIRWKYFHTQ